MKQKVAEAALTYIESGAVIGVGTGSTVNYFIDGLAKCRIDGAVASSLATEHRLREAGIRVLDLNAVGDLPLYVDGADEVDDTRCLIKGGGGALVREKIVAAASARFLCIVDETKRVPVLGRFPLPIEVIAMARSLVGRQLVKKGGRPVYREGVVTDNGNVILDVHDLLIAEPLAWEQALNAMPGVVDNGIFAIHRADEVLIGSAAGVEVF